MEIQNQKEIIQPPVPPAPLDQTQKEKPKISKKYLILLGVIFAVVVVLALFSISSLNGKKSQSSPALTTSSINEALNDFFKSDLSGESIADLKINSLPDSKFVRGVARYKNSLWVSGDGSLIEYDSDSNLIKKFSDPTKAKCDSNIVIVGNYLFAPCRTLNGTEKELPSYSLYKINLHTLKIEKIFTAKDGLKSLDNFDVYQDGEYVWISTFNGVARINSKSNNVNFYTSEMGIGGYSEGDRYSTRRVLPDKDFVWVEVVASAYSTGGVSRFDKKTQTWIPFGPKQIIGADSPQNRIDFEGIKFIDGGIRVAFRKDGVSTNDSLVEKDFLYSNSNWTTVSDNLPMSGANSDPTYDYIKNNYYYVSGEYGEEDGEGFIQVYSNKKLVNKINGRAYLWMSDLLGDTKRYLITGASVDVIKDLHKIPEIVFGFGRNMDNSDPHPTNPDVKFYASSDSDLAIVIDPNYFLGFEGPEQWGDMNVWVVDLKNDKLIKKFTTNNKYEWRKSFGNDSPLIGQDGKQTSVIKQGDVIGVLMDGNPIIEYNSKLSTLEFFQ